VLRLRSAAVALGAVLLALLPAALSAGPGRAPPRPASSCVDCHESQARASEGALHASCTDCHAGDSTKKDAGLAHARMIPSDRASAPALCARCHSDARLMNPFGLSIDQHAQFVTSRHGSALAKGSTDAATCVDCHGGAHAIRRVRDATSAAHPRNVPDTCARCHADAPLMQRHGLRADAPALYRDGVHGRLHAAGDRAAPTCSTCHGNHGATPPGFAEVAHACGKCHARQREAFESSPHAFYARDGSFQGCVACHASHRIVQDAPTILTRCAPCHEEKDPEMKKGRDLVAVAAAPKADFARTSERLSAAARAGAHVDDEQLLLEAARTTLLQIPPTLHALDAKRIDALAAETRATLATIDARLDARQRSERLRRLALFPIWIFLAAMAALFWAKRRKLEADHGR
jgi:hypothetical protein